METLVGEHNAGGHYHDASEHGLSWAVLNESLHIIVFVYTLYGMINFKVKFIRMIKLVKWMSRLIIAHNWYLSIKFGLLALLMYFYNARLEITGVDLASFNCSLSNYQLVVSQQQVLKKAMVPMTTVPPEEYELIASKTRHVADDEAYLAALIDSGGIGISQDQTSYDRAFARFPPLGALPGHIFGLDYMPHLNHLLDVYGGPFKLLGNRATLMYGFYSIAIFIMLAIFPVELMYFFEVGFNFTRFVLSDPGCMRDLYERRKRHLECLSSLSRNRTDSYLSKSTKMNLTKRDLRTNYTDEANVVANYLLHRRNQLKSLAIKPAAAGGGKRRRRRLTSRAGRFEKIVEETSFGGEAEAEATAVVAVPAGANTKQLLPPPPPPAAENRTNRFSLFQMGLSLLGLSSRSRVAPIGGDLGPNRRANKHHESKRVSLVKSKLSKNIKQLHGRMATSVGDKPSYQVRVAEKNLEHFKPFVRSHRWFKASMIIYPIFIFFYFAALVVVIGFIQYYFESNLVDEVYANCAKSAVGSGSAGNNTTTTNLTESVISQFTSQWSYLDTLMYYENIYTVYALSTASSFYCSYYFSTILELYVWLAEVKQQLELCAHVINLNGEVTHSNEPESLNIKRFVRENSNHRCPATVKQLQMIDEYVNDFGGFNKLFPRGQMQLRRGLRHLKTFTVNCLMLKVWKVRELFVFLWDCLDDDELDMNTAKKRHLSALKMLNKQQTLMRATYVNMCLFFDELYETRFMTTTILTRTTQIAAGFAFVASMTRSQFKANFSTLTLLLLAVFIVLNSYLAAAAWLNSSINKLLVRIHSIICASIKHGYEDTDLFEYWVRQVESFGDDKDRYAYKIYGYKVTWSSILNVSDQRRRILAN